MVFTLVAEKGVAMDYREKNNYGFYSKVGDFLMIFMVQGSRVNIFVKDVSLDRVLFNFSHESTYHNMLSVELKYVNVPWPNKVSKATEETIYMSTLYLQNYVGNSKMSEEFVNTLYELMMAIYTNQTVVIIGKSEYGDERIRLQWEDS